MTDEQFKAWASSFYDRVEMIHTWREAARTVYDRSKQAA